MAPERPSASQSDLGVPPSGGEAGAGAPRGWWKWLVAAASFGLFAAVLWYAYTSGTGADGGPIRTVTADPEPYKVRPKDPGGQKVPDQDKLIYGEAVGRPAESPETLAKPAEEPMEIATAKPAAPATPAQQPEAVQAPRQPAPATLQAPKPEPEAAPASAPTTPPAPKAESGPAPKVASTGNYRVQIGSFKTREAADQAWARIAPKHPSVLSNAEKLVKQADLGASGTWYRLQFGPYASRAAADRACRQLKAAGQDCLVDAP